jgi:PAS domain S-box-containing protein
VTESLWKTVDATSDWIWNIDTEGRYTFSSVAVQEILGYSPAEIIGHHFYDFFLEEEREPLKAELLKTIQKREPFIALRNRNMRKDGRVVILETTGFPILGSEGEFLGYQGVDRDVTAQVKTAEALQRSEKGLRAANEELERIMDAMGEGLVVMDSEHRMTQLNEKACELFQYPREEILGKAYTFWAHPDFTDILRKELEKREKGAKSTYETLYCRKDGSEFWAQVTAVPIVDEEGNYQGSIGCLRDITEEKKLADEMDRLYEFNEKLIRGASVWINVTDPEGKITLWNEEAERISGYSRHEVLGDSKIWEWLYPNEKYRENIWEQQQMLAKTGNSRRIDTTIYTKEGKEKVIAWYGTPLLDENEQETVWMAVGHDMTQTRRNEEQLQTCANTLSALSKEKDRFMATAAHELRTPLTVIQGFADLLMKRDNLDAEQRTKIEGIKNQSKRLDTLIASLLDISRIEAGESALVLERIDLTATLNKVITELTPRLARKGQKLNYSQHPVQVYADEMAVKQILINLFDNAISYTPAGGKITVRTEAMEGSIQVEICDAGIGITPEEQQSIFIDFYRSPQAKQIKPHGNGLGLPIVKRLLEEMHGSILVKSAGKDQGSSFSITLPADRAHTSGTVPPFAGERRD